MPYKIVQTLEGKKIKLMTCPSGWEKNNILKYPKKGLFKYVHDENSTPEPDWDVMMCIVKRSNIPSYNDGEKIITDMANRSDTDDAEGNNYPRKRYKSQETLNLNIVADKIVKTRRTQKEPSAINLNNMAETMVENVLYFADHQENLANASITSATELPQDVYVPYETDNPAVQQTISIDIDNISDSQKQMLEHQRQIMENQQVMLENQKQLMDINTAVMAQTQNLIKIQNSILQKLSSFSVQLEDTVLQITGMRNTDNDVVYLKDSKSLDRTPFSIKAIDSPMELDSLEKELSNDSNRNSLKHTYAIVCSKGNKGVDCAYTLVDIMFTRKFLSQCSWSGGSRSDDLKVPLKGYKHVLSFFWELVNFWDETFTLTENTNFFKTILKNAHKRKLAKCERASTSRKRSKTSTKMNKNETHSREGESQNEEAEKESQIGIEKTHSGEGETQNEDAEKKPR